MLNETKREKIGIISGDRTLKYDAKLRKEKEPTIQGKQKQETSAKVDESNYLLERKDLLLREKEKFAKEYLGKFCREKKKRDENESKVQTRNRLQNE